GGVEGGGPLDRAGSGREDDDLALLGGDRFAARLRPRPLLDQQEIPALVVDAAAAQEARELQREHHVAVEILVQAVVAPRLVLQQQCSRFRLAALPAPSQPPSYLLPYNPILLDPT